MPKIICSDMPSIEVKRFCRTFCEAIKQSTDDMGFREKFDKHIKHKKVDSLEHENKDFNCAAGYGGNSYTANHT